MKIRSPVPLALLALFVAAAFLAGCASTGAQAGDQPGISIRVHNNLVPSRTVSISAVRQGGSPIRLGSLVAGAEETFTFRPIVSTGTYRLVADLPGPGGSMVSEPIGFVEGGTATVTWDLSNNNVIVR